MKEFLNNFTFDEHNKDTKLNMSNLLRNSDKTIPDKLVHMSILAVLLFNEHSLTDTFYNDSELNEEDLFNVKAAKDIMNMNNIYYRGKHLLGSEYATVKANLRMNIYNNDKINKDEFEFISLVISFINNCEFCIKSHAKLLQKNGFTVEQIHEGLRIASIVNSLSKI